MQNKTTSPSRCFANSCSSPKGLFYIFKIHLKSLLLDYQQYNADRRHWMQHIAQPDFIFFLILNSAKGCFFSFSQQECSRATVEKPKFYFVQWTADINKINMEGKKKEEKSNFVRKIK